MAGAMVSIGNVSCTNVQIVNSTTLRYTTGMHAAGAVDVVVTVNGVTGTLTNGYTYGAITPQPTPTRPAAATIGTPGAVEATHAAGTVVTGATPVPQPMRH